MTRHPSRREFMGLAAFGAAGLASKSPFGWLMPAEPELVVLNAKVYTMDRAQPRAQAFAISRDRIVGVGSNDAMRALRGKRTRIWDAKGMTIVPGFIDCHNHASGTWLLYEVLVGNPFEVEFVSIDSIVEKLRAKAATLPPGTWVEGYFHDDTKLKDKRPLTRQDLDRVSTEHPVMVLHRGGHTAFYNTKAFELAGITKATPDVEGGTYDKGPDGELNGRVTDRARDPINRAGKRPPLTDAERAKRERDGAAHISKEFARYGLTTVHHEGGDLAALQDIRARGDLRHRVSYEPQGQMVDRFITEGIRTGFGDDWIRIGATSEHIVDGSFSERTLARSTPYPGTNYKGNITESQDVLNAWVEHVHRGGIQVNVHANGDVAIDMYLTAVERALTIHPVSNARPKVTHCTMVNADLVRRMKAVDAIPALFTTYAYYNSDKFPFYGEEMMKNAMAFRSLIDAGVNVCAGSDFYPGPFSPLMGIQGMVTRRGWDGTTWGLNQRISVDEAIRVNSLNGAYASFEEQSKGSITEGKLADYVVLADDPHAVNPEKIKDIRIVRTVVGGTTTHEG